MKDPAVRKRRLLKCLLSAIVIEPSRPCRAARNFARGAGLTSKKGEMEEFLGMTLSEVAEVLKERDP